MPSCSKDFIVHANVLASVGLGDVAVGGSSLSGGRVGSKVVNHLGIEFLNSLGLSAARVTAATTSSAVATAGSLLSGGGVLGILLGLGRGSGRLRTGLLAVDESASEGKNNRVGLSHTQCAR